MDGYVEIGAGGGSKQILSAGLFILIGFILINYLHRSQLTYKRKERKVDI